MFKAFLIVLFTIFICLLVEFSSRVSQPGGLVLAACGSLIIFGFYVLTLRAVNV